MMTKDYDRDRQLCFEDGSIHVLHALDHISVIFFCTCKVLWKFC